MTQPLCQSARDQERINTPPGSSGTPSVTTLAEHCAAAAQWTTCPSERPRSRASRMGSGCPASQYTPSTGTAYLQREGWLEGLRNVGNKLLMSGWDPRPLCHEEWEGSTGVDGSDGPPCRSAASLATGPGGAGPRTSEPLAATPGSVCSWEATEAARGSRRKLQVALLCDSGTSTGSLGALSPPGRAFLTHCLPKSTQVQTAGLSQPARLSPLVLDLLLTHQNPRAREVQEQPNAFSPGPPSWESPPHWLRGATRSPVPSLRC